MLRFKRAPSARVNSRSSQLGKYPGTHPPSPWRHAINRSSKQKTSFPVPHPTVKSLFALVYATVLLTLKPRWLQHTWALYVRLCRCNRGWLTRPQRRQKNKHMTSRTRALSFSVIAFEKPLQGLFSFRPFSCRQADLCIWFFSFHFLIPFRCFMQLMSKNRKPSQPPPPNLECSCVNHMTSLVEEASGWISGFTGIKVEWILCVC